MASEPTGWMPNVEHVPTREYGYSDVAEDQMWPQAVMHHVMQGYFQTMYNWAKNNNGGISANFIVSREGRIVQTVSIWDPAWHAGDVNSPSWRLYPALAQQYGPNPNKFTVGIEMEGFSLDPMPNYAADYIYSAQRPWPPALIEAVIRINHFVFQSCANWMKPSRDTVITHSMTNTRSRTQDPGDLWVNTVLPQILQSFQQPDPIPPVQPVPIPTPPQVPIIAIRAALDNAQGQIDEAKRLLG